MIELKENNVTAADDDVAIARPVAVAVDVDVASPGVGLRLNHEIIPTSTIELGEKQGSKFCGFCCDLRTAVIDLASLRIIVLSIYLILALTSVFIGSVVVVVAGTGADEQVKSSRIAFAAGSAFIAIAYGMGVLFNIFLLVAAIKYNVCMLATAVVFECILLILNLLGTFGDEGNDIIGAIFYIAIWVIFVYPTVGLIVEIKKGIMSKDTLPREKYNCC